MFSKEYFNDDTGRFVIISLKTNKRYIIEPIHNNKTLGWGDVNVVTKNTEGAYGTKYKGSIDIDESIITEENGCTNISFTKIGESPYSYIEQLEKNL